MASTDLAVARSFEELARLVGRVSSVEVRIRRADGSEIEGLIHHVDYVNALFIEEHSGYFIEVSAHELQTLDVNLPRRGREWTMAILGIIVTTTALVGYAQLPWVPARPRDVDILVGFIALMAIVAGLARIPSLQKWFASWFSRWERIYPVGAQASGARLVQGGDD